MRQNDYEYFSKREQAERFRAEHASDSSARSAHKAMAEVYAERLKTLAAQSAAIPLASAS